MTYVYQVDIALNRLGYKWHELKQWLADEVPRGVSPAEVVDCSYVYRFEFDRENDARKFVHRWGEYAIKVNDP